MRALSLAVLFLLVTASLTACAPPTNKTYIIKDECGPIYGNILHSIKDDGACRIRCRGTCDSHDMQFVSSNFTDKGIECHLCSCTCSS
jgi:hypothetical protein